jgi:hypothetical protein
MQTVSVVVPVHGGARHLAQTLRAVAAQTHRVHEVLLVDDASPDDSVAIARNEAQASAMPLRVLAQARGGVSRARNTGWAAAKGEFVVFLDQDDVWHPEHLARQLQVFAQDPGIGVVVSPYLHWYPGPQGQHRTPEDLWPPARPSVPDPDFSGWVYHQFLRDCWALTSATLLRRELLASSGGFDVALPFSEDWDLWLRLARSQRFVLIDWPPVLYRQHAVQGSRVVREIDYRCRLLLDTAERHGLASADGRAVPPAEFNALIARYQIEFGYHHLQHGDRALALRTLWQAWRRRPGQLRPLLLATAGSLGWRPRRQTLGRRRDGLAAE